MNAPQPLRFTRADYHRMGAMGLFAPHPHVELIHGEIIEMSPKGIAHEACLRTLLRQLFAMVSESYVIGCQSPISIGDSSEPEPDVSIAIGSEANYTERHPTGREVLLAIEISDSTLQFDQTAKLHLYAESQILHYWIFNLVDHRLEAYRNPVRNDRDWQYQEVQTYAAGDQIELPLTTNSGQPLLLDLGKIAF